jgi:DNA-binding NarL/FixJ family response regulator
MSKTTILLADDHTLLRAGLRSLLEGMDGFEVVAEAGDGAEALALIRRHRPDVVLMDVHMKGMSGIEAAEHAKRDFPDVRVIMLSMHAEEEYVARALQAGASGYMLKDAATLELQLALTVVMKGEMYLSPAVSRQVVEGYVRSGAANPAAQLTERQREILKLIAEGLSSKEIAYRLGLSAKTVDTHRAQIMERLGIRDIAGLVRFAIRAGLVSLDKQ